MAEPSQAGASRPKSDWIKRKTSGREKAYGATGLVMTAHYLIKCFSGGHFHWAVPEDSLVDFYACILIVPLSLIWDIGINRLQHAAGIDGEE